MSYSDFSCPECQCHPLDHLDGHLVCPACTARYPLAGTVPLLFPARELSTRIEDREFTLTDVRSIYDRVYTHDGLMGTDLDENYDRTTKEILLSFGGDLTECRVLDVGTGVGRLWDYVPSGVSGYALEPSVVGAVKAATHRPDLTVSASVGEHLPYPDCFFDLVVSADTIEHTFSPERTLSEIHRVLRFGGVFSASFPIPDSLRKWGWNQLVKRRFNPVFIARTFWVVWKRYWLFGSPTFQPIDRDFEASTWLSLVKDAGFEVCEILEWPPAPELPIVYLVHAQKK